MKKLRFVSDEVTNHKKFSQDEVQALRDKMGEKSTKGFGYHGEISLNFLIKLKIIEDFNIHLRS